MVFEVGLQRAADAAALSTPAFHDAAGEIAGLELGGGLAEKLGFGSAGGEEHPAGRKGHDFDVVSHGGDGIEPLAEAAGDHRGGADVVTHGGLDGELVLYAADLPGEMGDLALEGCLHFVEPRHERLLRGESLAGGGGELCLQARHQHQGPRTPEGGEDSSGDEAAHGFHFEMEGGDQAAAAWASTSALVRRRTWPC